MINLFKNLHLKLLSVFAAVILWLFVVGVENYVHLFPTELPVKVVNLGQNVSVANEISPVKVRYKTPNGHITVNASDFELTLDAHGLGEGEYVLPVMFTSKNVQVSVVAVEPAKLALKLEAITSKDISVKAEMVGSPSRDYEIKNYKLDTEKVKLSGAASAISELKVLPIKITLDGTETADFSRKITLEAPPEWKLSGKTVSFDPPVIQANIEVRKKPNSDAAANNTTSDNNQANIPLAEGNERKTMMVQIIAEGDLTTSVKELLPKNILVTVEGKPEALAVLDNGSIKLNLKSSEIQNGIYRVSENDLILPAGNNLKVITYSPEKVLVRF
jgi:YbbR domain-containing protein